MILQNALDLVFAYSSLHWTNKAGQYSAPAIECKQPDAIGYAILPQQALRQARQRA